MANIWQTYGKHMANISSVSYILCWYGKHMANISSVSYILCSYGKHMANIWSVSYILCWYGKHMANISSVSRILCSYAQNPYVLTQNKCYRSYECFPVRQYSYWQYSAAQYMILLSFQVYKCMNVISQSHQSISTMKSNAHISTYMLCNSYDCYIWMQYRRARVPSMECTEKRCTTTNSASATSMTRSLLNSSTPWHTFSFLSALIHILYITTIERTFQTFCLRIAHFR